MNNTKICPNCKTENPVVASYCRHCRYEFPEATKNGASVSPQILSFKLKESDYTIGSVIHFDWTVENATIIKLNQYDVTSNGTTEMTVEKAESITLTAENEYDKTTRTIRLSPRPQPSIRLFSASSLSIRSGQEVKLKWDCRNTVKAVLISSDGEIDVTNKSFIKVSPNNTETYQLVCYSCDERIFEEQSLQISVVAPVVIRGFYADKEVVAESDKVILTWDVDNATSIMLYPLMKDLSKQRRYELSPSRTTEYRLVASNMISRAEASLSVGVRTLPKVDINFGDAFAKMELPSCNVDLSFISDNIKEAQIDRWLLFPSSNTIQSRIHSSAFKCKFQHFKSMIRRLISIPFRFLQKQRSANM